MRFNASLLVAVCLISGCSSRDPITPRPVAHASAPTAPVVEAPPPAATPTTPIAALPVALAEPVPADPEVAKHLTRFRFPAARTEEFLRWSKEGGVWTEIPPHLVPKNLFSEERLREEMQGDEMILLGYAQDRHRQRWHAIMAPIIWITTDRVEVGFEGNALAFDVDAARQRWKRRKFKEGLSADLADKVADELIRREESRTTTAASLNTDGR